MRSKLELVFEKMILKNTNFTVQYNYNFTEPTVLPENESPYHVYYKKEAMQYSAYIQDKMEYSSMIMNLGVRYDAFVPSDSSISNLVYPEAGKTKANNKIMVSPRVGVSLPITEKGIFHFSYGHFYQMPTLRNLYRKLFWGWLSPTVGSQTSNLRKQSYMNSVFSNNLEPYWDGHKSFKRYP